MTLTVIAVLVVFGCLLILFGIYSLSGALFSGKLGLARRERKATAKEDAEIAAAIALALEAEAGTEEQAAIALALHLYCTESVHDHESGTITIKGNSGSRWGDKGLNFRKTPIRKQI